MKVEKTSKHWKFVDTKYVQSKFFFSVFPKYLGNQTKNQRMSRMEPVWESVEIPIIECIPNLSALITGEHIEIVFGKYICLLENGKSVLYIENNVLTMNWTQISRYFSFFVHMGF